MWSACILDTLHVFIVPPARPIDRWLITKQGFKEIVRDRSGKLVIRKSLLFLIRRSIGELGYKGTYFFDEAVANTYAEIAETMGEGISEWFLNQIEEFITGKKTNNKKWAYKY